jgi:hypothetical protein
MVVLMGEHGRHSHSRILGDEEAQNALCVVVRLGMHACMHAKCLLVHSPAFPDFGQTPAWAPHEAPAHLITVTMRLRWTKEEHCESHIAIEAVLGQRLKIRARDARRLQDPGTLLAEQTPVSPAESCR